MNDFLKKAMNVAETENGALSYATTGDECVNQFGKAGSYRGRNMDDVFKEQETLWNENKEFAVKFPFYLRMITRKTKLQNGDVTTSLQRGQGARDESFKRLLWFEKEQPELFYKNLWLLPIVGSWKDIWVLLTMSDTLDREKVYTIIAEGCQNETQKDLVKKYLPQIRSSKKCTTEWATKTNLLAKDFCKWAGWTQKEYRKFKATGKAHEFQKYISTKQYDKLNWNKISGKALLNISTSKFLTNQNLFDKYLEWISEKCDVNFNGYPYELGKKLNPFICNKGSNYTQKEITKLTIDKQFEHLIKNSKDGNGAINGNVWCALDTSGSMTSRVSNKSDLTAYDVCISLGIYFSTLNEGAFNKNVIMFDSDSKIKQLKGTFSEMYYDIASSETAWGSTNFQSVIDEIVRIRSNYPNIPLKDYPSTILVVSDMQFDCAGKLNTNYEAMKKKLYSVFPNDFVNSMKFIWWNVISRNNDMPATLDDGGCYFFSGFDGSIISLLLGGEQITDKETGEQRKPTMQEIIEITMNQEILTMLEY